MKAISSRLWLNTWMNSVRACSISALLLFFFLAPSSARADVTNDIAQILAVLQSMNNDGVYTLPLADNIDYQYLSEYLSPYFEQIINLRYGSFSYNAGLVFLHALSGTSNPSTANTLPGIVPLLVALCGITNDLSNISATTLDIDHVADGLLASFLQLSDQYFYGAHSYAWDVHLDDSSVGAISDGFDWLGGYLSNVVEHVGADMGGYLSNIDPYVSDIASAVDSEYETGHMADEFEESDEYIQDDLYTSTNDLAQLDIDAGELPDTSSILDGVDANEFNMLPSLTGADPVIQVYHADSNLPNFSIDFSVPPGIYNLISLFCTWLWRVLFFVSMWRLVEGEYNYWTTLGGGA